MFSLPYLYILTFKNWKVNGLLYKLRKLNPLILTEWEETKTRYFLPIAPFVMVQTIPPQNPTFLPTIQFWPWHFWYFCLLCKTNLVTVINRRHSPLIHNILKATELNVGIKRIKKWMAELLLLTVTNFVRLIHHFICFFISFLQCRSTISVRKLPEMRAKEIVAISAIFFFLFRLHRAASRPVSTSIVFVSLVVVVYSKMSWNHLAVMRQTTTPSPWLTRIRFTRISLTRIFKKFPFLT